MIASRSPALSPVSALVAQRVTGLGVGSSPGTKVGREIDRGCAPVCEHRLGVVIGTIRRHKIADDTALQPRSGCKCQLDCLADIDRLLTGDFIQRGAESIEESVIDLNERATSVGLRDEHAANG